MGITPVKFIRKPLFVDAIRVTQSNFDQVVEWCQGTVETDETSKKAYIKVRVHNPKNARQSKAFVGDWLLYTERGYKVYTNKAFHASFDKAKPASKEELEAAFPPKQRAKAKPQADPRSQKEKAKQEAVLERAAPVAEEPVVHEGDKGEAIAEGREAFPTDTGPVESPEMAQAIETIEAEGGTVEEATPEAIADVVLTNEQVMAQEQVKAERLADTMGVSVQEAKDVLAPVEGSHTVEVEVEQSGPVRSHVSASSTAPPDNRPQETVAVPVDPETAEAAAAASDAAQAYNPQVLSVQDQEQLGADEVRKLLQSGEAVLAQDVFQS